MKIVVKLGGTLLEDPRTRASIAGQLARLVRDHELVIVHGGGKQVTQFLEKQGLPSRFVNGLRVSDQAVVDAVTNVVAGSVNKILVAALLREGIRAVGISGVDGCLTTAAELNPELGFVGKLIGTDPTLLHTLRSAGYVPVVACIAADKLGTIFNVNADEMAVSCAAAYGARRLIFLTDVPGVKNGQGQIVPDLNASDALELIRSGAAQGGMYAKLQASAAALNQGISEIYIASGQEPDICARIIAGEPAGTCLHR